MDHWESLNAEAGPVAHGYVRKSHPSYYNRSLICFELSVCVKN